MSEMAKGRMRSAKGVAVSSSQGKNLGVRWTGQGDWQLAGRFQQKGVAVLGAPSCGSPAQGPARARLMTRVWGGVHQGP